MFNRLVEIDQTQPICRGSILRFPAVWPHEAILDLMVFYPTKEDTGMGLIVSSGYKAGLFLVYLPEDSSGEWAKSAQVISPKWLIKNWGEWVYPTCPVEDVYISKGYPIPNELPFH